jgi:hypothetical protein
MVVFSAIEVFLRFSAEYASLSHLSCLSGQGWDGDDNTFDNWQQDGREAGSLLRPFLAYILICRIQSLRIA